MTDMRQFTATPTVEELEQRIEEREAEIRSLSGVIASQQQRIEELEAEVKHTEELHAAILALTGEALAALQETDDE